MHIAWKEDSTLKGDNAIYIHIHTHIYIHFNSHQEWRPFFLYTLWYFQSTVLSKHEFPQWLSSKKSTCKAGAAGGRFSPWVWKMPWRTAWPRTPVFLPGESHGQRTLWATVHRVANSQTQLKQLSTRAQISEWTVNFSLSCAPITGYL